MTESFTPDELLEDGNRYYYRDGNWTDEKGMRVPITRSQKMTMTFYETYGRMPVVEPKPKARRANSKAAKAKAAAVRAAIAKAVDGKRKRD